MDIGLIFLFFPFLILFMYLTIRKQKKALTELAVLQENLKLNDEVITHVGIIGKVVGLDADTVCLEIADGLRINWSRQAIKNLRQTGDKN